MGWKPCAIDRHVFPGKATWVAVSLVDGPNRVGGKLNLCGAHWAEMQESLITKLTIVTDETPIPTGNARACNLCGEMCSGEDLSAAFVTYYSPKQDRVDAFGEVCGSCFDDAVAGLHVDLAQAS